MPARPLNLNLFKVLSIAFAVLILLLIIAFTFLPNYTKIKELNRKEKALSQKIKEVKEENQELKTDLELLKGDVFYLEKIAREKFGAAKDKEVTIQIEE